VTSSGVIDEVLRMKSCGKHDTVLGHKACTHLFDELGPGPRKRNAGQEGRGYEETFKKKRK